MRRLVRCLLLVAALASAALAAPAAGATAAGARVLSAEQAGALDAGLRAGVLPAGITPRPVCTAHHLHCQARVLIDAAGRPVSAARPLGYGPAELARINRLAGAGSTHATVAVIDIGGYPTAAADLAVYRRQYGLPPCTVAGGCLRIVNYTGGAPYGQPSDPETAYLDWQTTIETSLDLDMVSAACPACRLLLIETPNTDLPLDPGQTQSVTQARHIATAVQTARRLGAAAASISYAYDPLPALESGAVARDLHVPGMAITAASGDVGYNGADGGPWPQNLATVTSVGGTSASTGPGGYRQVAWSLAGSSCGGAASPRPALGQPVAVAANCFGARAASDISAVADPQTGVAVYDSYDPKATYDGQSTASLGWIPVGGTSASSPYVAALWARAGVTARVDGPRTLYARPASAFTDVVIGQNAPAGVCPLLGARVRVCDAGRGWDGPTGRGAPNGLAPFR